MGIAISEVLASLELRFYARSIVRMVLRRLTEKKHSFSDELNVEIVTLILHPQTLDIVYPGLYIFIPI